MSKKKSTFYSVITFALLLVSVVSGAGIANADHNGDGTPLTVTIDQAGGQADPTNDSIINFTVTFSEAVAGFADGDILLSGTAAETDAVVTGSFDTFNVAVSGMANDGTVVVSVPADVATDGVGHGNQASTSDDNQVTFDTTPPTVTIDQAGGQADPANDSAIDFTVTFSEDVVGFDGNDILFSGTAGADSAKVTGGPATYNVAVSGMANNGTVIATFAAGAASDIAGNASLVPTSTDNTVTYDNAPPGQPGVPVLDAASDSAVVGDNITSVDVPIFTGAAGAVEADSTVTLYADPTDAAAVDPVEVGSALATSTGGYSVEASQLPDGVYNITVTATDPLNNESDPSPALQVTIDTTAPSVTPPQDIDVEATDPAIDPGTLEASGSASSLNPLIFSFIASAVATDGLDPSPAIASDAPPLFLIGQTLVTFTATDAAGNEDSGSATVTVADTIAPTLTVPSEEVEVFANVATGAEVDFLTLLTLGSSLSMMWTKPRPSTARLLPNRCSWWTPPPPSIAPPRIFPTTAACNLSP